MADRGTFLNVNQSETKNQPIMKPFYLLILFCIPAILVRGQVDCETAIEIEEGLHHVEGFVGEAPPVNCITYSNGTAGMWYSFVATEDAAMKLTTSLLQNQGIDTRFHVYTGECSALVWAGGDDDSGTGFLAELMFLVEAGTVYYIVFDNRWNNSDPFDFKLEQFEIPDVWFNPVVYNLCTTVRAAVDLNGDFLDDIVGGSVDMVSAAYQLPEGGFEYASYPINASNEPNWSMAAGDLDRNGYNDLVFGGGSGVSIIMANETGDGYFVAHETPDSVYVFSQSSNMVDINNDGHLDVFVCHDVAPNVYFMNTGDGQGFEFHQGGLGDVPQGGNYGSIWVDYDNDGDLDLFLSKCRGGNTPAKINELHRNNGDGTFTEVGEELGMNHSVQTWSSAWGDFDNDGDMDVMIGASSNMDGGHVFMVNNGDGTFTDGTQGSGFDVMPNLSVEWVTHDFNNDGYLDVLGDGVLMINNGDMTFSPVNVQFQNGPVGDFNNDGFLDVVHGNRVFFNTGNDNNYLVVHAVGTVSNANGIGARITVYSPSFDQIREIRSGDGFRYMSSLNAYFGLGTDEVIDSIKVVWPSGIVDMIYDAPINGPLLIVEGSTAVSVDHPAFEDAVVYPNPARDRVNVRSPFISGDSRVSVYDIKGRKVLDASLVENAFSVSGLVPGIYLVRIDLSEGTVERTLVVQ